MTALQGNRIGNRFDDIMVAGMASSDEATPMPEARADHDIEKQKIDPNAVIL
jgi:hypothetical protein